MSTRKLAFWGACLTLTAAAAPWLFGHFTGGFEAYARVLARVPATHWLAALAGTVVFYMLDWVRYASLLAIFGHRLPLKAGFRLTCVSYFVSALTPSAELHFPFMIFLLAREGIPLAHATAATITKSIYMVFWICLFALVSLRLGATGVRLPDEVATHLPLIVLPFSCIVAALALIVVFPRPIHAWAERRLRPDSPAWIRRIVGGLDHGAQALATIAGSTHRMHLVAHAGSATFVLAYAWVGFWLARGAGIAITAGKAITVFSNGLMVAYLAPVPGGVGVTELFTNYMIDPAMTHDGMAVCLTQRILCWYGVMVPGAFFLLGYAGQLRGALAGVLSGARK